MTATKLKLALGAIVVASAATALVVQQQSQAKLRAQNESLTQQLAQLQTDNASLSNRLAEIGDAKKLSDDQFNELLKLRGEVGVLRRQLNEVGNVRAENQQLHSKLSQANINQEPAETKLPEDVIPPGQVYFSNISADQVFNIYSFLNGEKIDVEGKIENLANTPLTYMNTNSMTRANAINALEKVFHEQAGVEFLHTDNHRVIVKIPQQN